MKPIIFWGATGQAIVLEEMLEARGYMLEAVVDNNISISSPFKGVQLLHGKNEFEDWYSQPGRDRHYFSVAIGGQGGVARMEIGTYLESKGLIPATLIHPTSFCAASAELGKAVQVLALAAVCARTRLGDHVIVNTTANIDHECIIGNGVHIGPGAKLAGCVEVGDHSFIGTGAIILPRKKIGKNVIVGAGAVVTRDIPDNSICYGNPARVQKENK
jgi:sugar O-acyltransferase (sialic acid O-acetyltransferase NeuD family)